MLGFGLLALLPFAAAGTVLPRQTACNNSPDLCSKSYGEITHLGAHDSPFVRDASTGYSTSGNQYFNTTVQLDAGVRLISAQVHKKDSEWHLCHSSCELLDAGKLSTWLSEIKSWLDSNKNDVVTLLLVNSDDASASDLHAQFKTANLVDYAYTPTSQTSAPSSWPTLESLINNGTRLMTFVASLDASKNTVAPYLMDEFTYIWENPYDVTSPSNFSCNPDRPSSLQNDLSSALSSNRLPFMNHFLYQTVLSLEYPNSSYVSTTNAPSGGTGNLGDAATKCKEAYSRQPAFILVDFFDKGPAIKTVDNLNGVTNAVGRTNLTAATQTSGASTYSNVFKGLVELVQSAKLGSNPSMGEWVWVGGDWGSLLGGGITL
ncbi:PLC-like phosphodiesterase [Aspergillus sergii]|uniref:PLC-like phosphodiesterase n=1 Tax=Aspergillus sergii TaxID=1034303 RepID=A0A5N6X4N5_9EURO|nr:PLC-like phosphodiesterase [Aspergillus sergii]